MTLPLQRHPPVAARGAPVAALPMYDLPGLHDATDILWAAIAGRLEAEGLAPPRALSRATPPEDLWSDPDLLLSQTCGYPLVTELKGRVQLVATPRYRAAGCAGPFHRSAVVVAAGNGAQDLHDLYGGRCAVNATTSNTGMNLLRAEISQLGRGAQFFRDVMITGSHLASLDAVAAGAADVAAIDCVTYALAVRLRPILARKLRILLWTTSSPGLPLITGAATPPETIASLRRALTGVVDDPGLRDVRRELLLDGFNILPAAQYGAILHLQQIAADRGYPRLA